MNKTEIKNTSKTFHTAPFTASQKWCAHYYISTSEIRSLWILKSSLKMMPYSWESGVLLNGFRDFHSGILLGQKKQRYGSLKLGVWKKSALSASLQQPSLIQDNPIILKVRHPITL